MRPLSARQATMCENATNPRCRCRCGGEHHGAKGKRSEMILRPDDVHRAAFVNSRQETVWQASERAIDRA